VLTTVDLRHQRCRTGWIHRPRAVGELDSWNWILGVSPTRNRSEMERKRFELSRVSGQLVSDADLLADLRRVAASLGKTTVGQKEYRHVGKYDDSTTTRRFGSWNAALKAASLTVSNEVGIEDQELFENILTLWQHYGRQPRRRDLALPPSRVSQSPYLRRFRSWTAALESFVQYANGADVEGAATIAPKSSADGLRRTSRTHLFVFASRSFSEIGSRAGRAARAPRHKQGSNFTLITSRPGARAARQSSRISRRYATGAILEKVLMVKRRASNRVNLTVRPVTVFANGASTAPVRTAGYAGRY
jgi:hypothetical protein